MKKVLILLVFVFVLSSYTVLASEIVIREVPFDVTINGQIISNDDEYPLLFYNEIVYLPTTFSMNNFVGLRVEFYPEYRVGDKKVGSIFIGLDKIKTSNYSSYPLMKKGTNATIQENVIVINSCYATNNIENFTREYPVINHKDILYIPLSYDIAVEKLDWKLSFSLESGLMVETRNPNKPILDAIHSNVVGFSYAPKAVKPPIYVYNENAYAAYPPDTFGGVEFRYKEVGEEEIRNIIPFTDGDYYFNRITTTGKDVAYGEKCVVSLESGGILRMPAVKKEYINGEYVGRNIYLTIDVKNGNVISIQ